LRRARDFSWEGSAFVAHVEQKTEHTESYLSDQVMKEEKHHEICMLEGTRVIRERIESKKG